MDVVINKLRANRPKDIYHVAAILKEGIVGLEEVQTAIAAVPYAFMMDEMLKSLANALAAAAKS